MIHTVIPALRKLRQKDSYKFEACLVYTVNAVSPNKQLKVVHGDVIGLRWGPQFLDNE